MHSHLCHWPTTTIADPVSTTPSLQRSSFAEEKLRTEAASFAWISKHCTHVPIPTLRGVGLPNGLTMSFKRTLGNASSADFLLHPPWWLSGHVLDDFLVSDVEKREPCNNHFNELCKTFAQLLAEGRKHMDCPGPIDGSHLSSTVERGSHFYFAAVGNPHAAYNVFINRLQLMFAPEQTSGPKYGHWQRSVAPYAPASLTERQSRKSRISLCYERNVSRSQSCSKSTYFYRLVPDCPSPPPLTRAFGTYTLVTPYNLEHQSSGGILPVISAWAPPLGG